MDCGLNGRLGAPVIAYIISTALGFHGTQLFCLLQDDLDCIDAVISNARCSFETVTPLQPKAFDMDMYSLINDTHYNLFR